MNLITQVSGFMSGIFLVALAIDVWLGRIESPSMTHRIVMCCILYYFK